MEKSEKMSKLDLRRAYGAQVGTCNTRPGQRTNIRASSAGMKIVCGSSTAGRYSVCRCATTAVVLVGMRQEAVLHALLPPTPVIASKERKSRHDSARG
jgi:hypothetical protein